MRSRIAAADKTAVKLRKALQEVEEKQRRERDLYRDLELTDEEYTECTVDLNRQKDEILAELATLSPKHLAELRRLESMVAGAEEYLEVSAARERLGLPMRQFSLHPDVAVSDAMDAVKAAEGWMNPKLERAHVAGPGAGARPAAGQDRDA